MIKNNMKVLIVNESLSLGGAESMSVELANALVEKNIKTYFTSAFGPLVNRLNKKIIFYEIPKYNLFSILGIINKLSNIILEIKPDIIHNHGATISIFVGIALKRSKLKSINILTHHSRRFTRLPHFLAVHLLNQYCDHIIAISQSKYIELQQIGIPINKISLFPNFIDCELMYKNICSYSKDTIYHQLNIPQDNYIITMVGRLIRAKRFDKFIKILAQCSIKLKKDVTGIIIGEGPMRKNLEELARNYSDKVKIYFIGYQEDVYKYLAISNIFLFPSEHEVLPMGLIEASASGIPIVCSNIPGNNEIVRNGYNGFLVNGSEKEYVDCINRILNNDDLALKMSRNGVKMAKSKFDRNIVVNNIILQYKKLLNYKDYMKKSSRKPS